VLDEFAGQLATAATGDEPALQPTLARVLEGLLALGSLGAESMVRDTGWFFLDLGRRLERALHLLALLRGTLVQPHSPAVDALVLESVLMASESVITYRRRHPAGPGSAGRPGGSPVQVAGVLDLLLLDRTNPRSLAFQLDRAETDLAQLPHPAEHAALDRALRASAARLREAGPVPLARSADGRRGGLADLLDQLIDEVSGLAIAVEAGHFVHPAPPRPLPTATPGWQ
jgi:uncharacterized alpha-E superfamily protein